MPKEPETIVITNEDAKALLHRASDVARRHTDVVLAVAKESGETSMASCVHVEFQGYQLLLTCAHVLRLEHMYFSNPKRLSLDQIDEEKYEVSSLRLLGHSPTFDLAVFDGTGLIQPESGKEPYPIARSDWFSQKRLQSQLGTAAFIYGLLGSASRVHQYPDGLVYLQAPMYTGMGPLVDVVQNEMVGDFAEKSLLILNDKSFPQLTGQQATGGLREIGGVSGSGMWMTFDGVQTLVGLVLGRRASSPGTHHVRATPIWTIREWLDTIIPSAFSSSA